MSDCDHDVCITCGDVAVEMTVVRLDGRPRVGAAAIESTGILPLGEWIETDANSRARIQVGVIGEATL